MSQMIPSQVETFAGKVGIVQRVLPEYRGPFFDRLATKCSGGLEVFAGEPQTGEGIRAIQDLEIARRRRAVNLNLGHIERHSWYICWQRNVLQWLKDWEPDVLIIEANPRLLSNWAAILFMRRQAKPVLGWGLGELPRSGFAIFRRFRQKIAMQLARACDGIITYGTKAAEDYASYGVDRNAIFVTYNAVSNETAKALQRRLVLEPEVVAAWKANVLSCDNKPIVLTVGRLLPQKRIDDLIRACAALENTCQLVIIGDGPERANLETLAQQVIPSTRFLGYQTGEDLALAFIAADVFVLPGTGGLAIQEAMIYGKPVIAADSDGTERDLVIPEVNGYLIKSGDIPGLTNRLEKLVNDKGLRRAMGEASSRIVSEKVNLNRMVQAFITAMNITTSRR